MLVHIDEFQPLPGRHQTLVRAQQYPEACAGYVFQALEVEGVTGIKAPQERLSLGALRGIEAPVSLRPVVPSRHLIDV